MLLSSKRMVFSISTCFRCGKSLHILKQSPFRHHASMSTSNSSNDGTSPSAESNNHSQIAVQKITSQAPVTRPRRNTKILRMDPSEYEGSGVLKKKLPLLERQGEVKTVYQHLVVEDEKLDARTNFLSYWQQDIDLRPQALKRIWSSIETEAEIKTQMFNPKRVSVLGRDLGAAHFIVARKGKVRFMGQDNWITDYRKDAKPGVEDIDLPVMTTELCSMPVLYDPNYRVQAIDASGVVLRYEGLANFENLHYVTWLSFRDSPLFNNWCLDRIYCNFAETLEYLDLSGCKGISAAGLCGVARLKKLNTLVVENMQHIQDLEIICATLEDQRPGLTCVGVDYAKKLEELRQENAEFEKKLLADEAIKEANTIDLTPRAQQNPNSSNNSSSVHNKTQE